uniref:Uncharacterized protein n=1 Tax=Acrobeloides nanus TaxID=290746 RepID=A0A914BVH2_9BILA
MYRTLDHVFMRTSTSPILFRILSNQKSLMFLALGSLISYGNVQPMRFLSDKSEKSKPLKELCRPYLFKIGPEKFYFHLNEHQIDMFTFISIIQFNRTTRTERHIWISIPSAKILVKKLKDMDNVEKIEGDSLKRMRPDEVLYEDAFLNCEINEEITLKLLPSRDGYLGIFCLENFELEIRRKSLPDESKESHIYVSSNVIHTFTTSLARILKRYEKLQDPTRQSGYKPLRVKSFDFGPVRYFLSLNETVKGIYMQLGESNSKAGIRRIMIIPITAAELMLPILEQAYEVILQNEGRSQMGIQPRTSLFEKCFIDSGREFTVHVKVSELAFRNFGDMILLLRSQDVQNEHKKFCIIIRSNGMPTFLKHFKRMLQKFEKLKPAKTGTAITEQLPKPRSDSIEYQPEQQHTLFKDLCKTSLFKIGSEEFYFNLVGRLVDMFTFINIGQHNRKTRTGHYLWISISAAKILVKKLEDVVEKIEGDSLKKMRPNEVLYESRFLDSEQNNEITLKLLPARDIYFGIFCFGKFDLEIFRKSLYDDSKATHVYVPSNAIHTFKAKLAEILKRYEKLQDAKN